MKRFIAATLFLTACLPATASAIELTKIRVLYGPLGATRDIKTVLPGEEIYMTYVIDGLGMDAKTAKVRYTTTLEMVDVAVPNKDNVVLKDIVDHEELPGLGGSQTSRSLYILLPAKQAPGPYEIRLTVNDPIGKTAKRFRFPFSVSARAFGMVGVAAPAVGFHGEQYALKFDLVNMALVPGNVPNVDVAIRILDARGKPVAAPTHIRVIGALSGNFIPLTHAITANRPGRFTMEVLAHDNIANKKTELRYPFTILDVARFTEPHVGGMAETVPHALPPVAVAQTPSPTESSSLARCCPRRVGILRRILGR